MSRRFIFYVLMFSCTQYCFSATQQEVQNLYNAVESSQVKAVQKLLSLHSFTVQELNYALTKARELYNHKDTVSARLGSKLIMSVRVLSFLGASSSMYKLLSGIMSISKLTKQYANENTHYIKVISNLTQRVHTGEIQQVELKNKIAALEREGGFFNACEAATLHAPCRQDEGQLGLLKSVLNIQEAHYKKQTDDQHLQLCPLKQSVIKAGLCAIISAGVLWYSMKKCSLLNEARLIVCSLETAAANKHKGTLTH